MEIKDVKINWKKWLIFYIIGVIIFTVFSKVLSILATSDILKIVLNSIFTGIGTAIGMYIGGGLIVEGWFKKKKEEKNGNSG